MISDVFSEGELLFRKQVEQFVRTIEERHPSEREILFTSAGQALKDILAEMAPNPPIIPIGTSPAGGGSSGSAGPTPTTQGTCPNCNYVFKITK